MEYKCDTISVDKIPIGYNGAILPLCEDCKTIDCSNSIEKISVSIMGVKRDLKVYMRGDTPYFVIRCSGFTVG